MNSRMWGWVYTVCVSLWLLPACGEDAAPKISEVSVQVEACLGAAAREDSCRDHLDQTVQAQPGVACLVVAAEDAPQRLWRVAFEWRAQGESSALTPLGEGQIPLTGDTPIEAALYFLAGADESACDALDLAQPCASLRSCALKLSQGGRPLSAGLNFKDPDDPSRCVVEAGEALQAAGDLVEICGDGLDNNCDGRIDEDCAGDCEEGVARGCTAEAQLGECREGTQTCSGGAWGACEPGEPKGEICGDGLDNNCDGQIDEGCDCIDGESRECGSNVGSCEMGTQICIGTTWGPCEESLGPQEEVCDGLDNDCDGVTDNVPGGCACAVGDRQQCGSDVGICEKGWQDCGDDGLWGACVGGQGPMPEVCDGLDNNCNETIDDGLSDCCAPDDEQPCNEDPLFIPESVCKVGMQTCLVVGDNNFGSWSECVDPQTNEPVRVRNQFEELCDGLDNNCDGTIDEGFNLQDDPRHCGACGYTCTHPDNLAMSCKRGRCVPADSDVNPPLLVDCQGGFEDGDGSVERPFKTLYDALDTIWRQGRLHDIYLATGICDVLAGVPTDYKIAVNNRGLVVVDGISIRGGYAPDARGWSRHGIEGAAGVGNRTVLTGSSVVLRYSRFGVGHPTIPAGAEPRSAKDFRQPSSFSSADLERDEFQLPTLLEGVSIQALAQTEHQRHPSVGVVAIGVGEQLTLRHVNILSEKGGVGIAGPPGAMATRTMQIDGQNGNGRTAGEGAQQGISAICEHVAPNTKVMVGGRGGDGPPGDTSNSAVGGNGDSGQTQGAGFPSGGDGGRGGYRAGGSGERAQPGQAGQEGFPGTSRQESPPFAGKINTDSGSSMTWLWWPDGGHVGTEGTVGGGGGGGGGGRSRSKQGGNNRPGGGGGGGGAGVCPGAGAGAATGGGGSFALYVMVGVVRLQEVDLHPGEGGKGGDGGLGGLGAKGGEAGWGATLSTSQDESDQQRNGAPGGKGGDGGCGGHSTGAHGGPSAAIMQVRLKVGSRYPSTGYRLEGLDGQLLEGPAMASARGRFGVGTGGEPGQGGGKNLPAHYLSPPEGYAVCNALSAADGAIGSAGATLCCALEDLNGTCQISTECP